MKKLLSAFLSLLMLLSVFNLTAFAENGPNEHNGTNAYIGFFNATDPNVNFNYVFYGPHPEEVAPVKGLSYNKSKNTLYISSFVNKDIVIETNEMGDDFKISVSGTNKIRHLKVFGFGYGGSLRITGSGSLTINEDKKDSEGILLAAEGSNASLSVDRYVALNVYGTNMSIAIVETAFDRGAIMFENDPENDIGMESEEFDICKNIDAIDCSQKISFKKYSLPNDTTVYLCRTVTFGVENPTSYYSMFTLYQTGGENYALPIANERDLLGVPNKYTDLDDSIECYGGQQSHLFTALKKENDNTEYATLDEFFNQEQLYSVYKIVNVGTNTNLAIPVEGQQNLSEIPAEYSTIPTGHLYSHYAKSKSVIVKAHVHSSKYTITKATTSKSGKIVKTCPVCGAYISTSVIYYPKYVKLSTTKYTYNGKVKKPSVKVIASNGKTISSSNYTVTYQSGRKNAGKYAVKITFKGNYSGKITKYFTISPKAPSLKSVSAKSKSFSAKWSKQSSGSGYLLQYSKSSKFSSAKNVKITSYKTISKTIKKLKGKQKYYVRVRTYKKTSSGTFYSGWSNKKKVTTKK